MLLADYSIGCEAPKYLAWRAYAWIMVMIYPLGIPSLYVVQLFRRRASIDPFVEPVEGEAPEDLQRRKLAVREKDKSILYLAFLFAEYEPRCYLFVAFDCVRKLMLTGLMIFVCRRGVRPRRREFG